ncbi:MAG TPA: flagellar motor protein MotB [Planctomycetota bacterium]|nr:flagellar motor protein MotB [Planctomycetota bacterium]
MAKKHKHEEHVNHERWLVSFADMMTLLFALFVVLYALGVQDLEKMKQLKQSVQWAFHIAGEGKTKDIGIFDNQTGGGDVSSSVPLVTAQDGGMREFLKETLPGYEEVAGRSLDVVQTSDTVSMTAPLSDFFAAGESFPIRADVERWFDRTLAASVTFTSDIRVIIEMPDVTIGQDARGRTVTSVDLCIERLKTLSRVVLRNPQIRAPMVSCEWRRQKPAIGKPVGNWEDKAVLVIAFSNVRPENR